MNTPIRYFSAVLTALYIIVLLNSPALAQTVATLYSKEGAVEGRFGSKDAAWQAVSKDKEFSVQDAIKVGPKSRAGVMFVDGMLIRLKSYSFLRFDSYSPEQPQEGELMLEKGEAYLFSRKNKPHPRLKTPIVSAAIRGTEFLIRTDDDSTTIEVIDGSVEASNEHGTVLARKGERVDVKRGSAPVKSVLVDVKNSIQWALHYPSVLVYDDVASFIDADAACWNAAVNGDLPTVSTQCGTGADADVVRAVALMESGSPSEAYGLLESKQSPKPAVRLLRAAMANSLGLLDQAEQDLRSVRSEKGVLGGIAESQRAIIALVSDKQERITPMMEYARTHAPDAASTAVAHAFIRQSRGDLDSAEKAIKQALVNNPDNAFLLALYAEYLHGQEDMAEALAMSSRALELAPDQHYARLVHGFILLTLGEYEDARHDFSSVVESEIENPLAHFGLGLYHMHNGDEELGQQHLERAVHISPNTAIYRSYLGKAFFETDQIDRSIGEYNIAIEKDDEDPTPFLYRAFSKLAQNDVVGALRDVTRSQARNDNRAVYRSQMSLDQDSAVRSASLSRIYNELFFREAGRIEAIKSISKDYTNFAAHRLLSAAYSGSSLFFSDAIQSQNRISTLLAPLSFNLFFGNGATDSFNEYTALFNKDEERSQVTVDYREVLDGGDANFIHAGKYGRVGYAVGGNHSLTQGTKDGRYQRNYRYESAVQWQPDYWNRFILEGAFQYGHIGGEDLSFDIDRRDYSGDARFSYRGKIDRNLQVLGTLGYTRTNGDVQQFVIERSALVTIDALDPDVSNGFSIDPLINSNFKVKDDFYFQELQGIGHYDWITSINGFVATQSDSRLTENSSVIDDTSFPSPEAENATFDIGPIIFAGLGWEYNNRATVSPNTLKAYTYNTVHLTSWLDVTGGVSYDNVEYALGTDFIPLDDNKAKITDWNPKVGVMIDPVDNLLLRASYTESTINGRGAFTGTLEPTLVSGLNQRFTGLARSGENEVYSFGIDYKFPGSAYLGTEYSNSDADTLIALNQRRLFFDFDDLIIDEDILGSLDGSNRTFDTLGVDQDIWTSYYYQVLTDRMVFSNTFRYFDGELSDALGSVLSTQEFKQLDSRLVYFGENGFIPMLIGTWRRNEETDSIILAESDDIANLSFSAYTVSTALAYRFPNRRGFMQLQLNNIFGKKTSAAIDRFSLIDVSQESFNVQLLTTFNF